MQAKLELDLRRAGTTKGCANWRNLWEAQSGRRKFCFTPETQGPLHRMTFPTECQGLVALC
jgi:hypothetical protein